MRIKHNPLPLAPTNQLKEASLTFLECTQLKPDRPFTASTPTGDSTPDASEEAEQTKISTKENTPQEDENQEVFYPKNYSYYFDDSDDSEFEYVPVDSEEDLNSIGSASDEEQEEESQELFVTHKPPFWYANEDPQHIEEILKKYSENLIKPSDYKNRSHQPFVARVQRHNITTGDVFQTYDVVLICNNQRLPDPTCPLPVIDEIHLLTFWDEDGIPFKFCTLGQQQIGFWHRKLEDIIPSYLRCVPDYFGQNPLNISESKFVFSTSEDYDDIYYSDLPWNHTPFNAFVKPRSNPSDDEPEYPSASLRFCCC